jgi:hypothetical protein
MDFPNAVCRSKKAEALMSRQVARQRAWVFLELAAGIVIAWVWAQKAAAQTAVNPDAALMQKFEMGVAEYLKLHKSAEATLPALRKPTESPEKIQHHKHELRKAILDRRAGVVQGNIFSPEIGAEFRRLIGIAYQADAQHIRESLLHAEPGTRQLRVRVNMEYPDNMPLQSMPPSLLLNLPALPPELEYRIVGRDLVLRDIEANLIVDKVTGVIPE